MFVVPVLPPTVRRRESRLPKSPTSAVKLGMFSEWVLSGDRMGRYGCMIVRGEDLPWYRVRVAQRTAVPIVRNALIAWGILERSAVAGDGEE